MYRYDKEGNRIDEFGRVVKRCKACKAHTPHIKGMCMGCKSRLEETPMYSQGWQCKKCRVSGIVMYKEDTEIEIVIMRIIEDHRGKTVICPARPRDIIIFPPTDKVQ